MKINIPDNIVMQLYFVSIISHLNMKRGLNFDMSKCQVKNEKLDEYLLNEILKYENQYQTLKQTLNNNPLDSEFLLCHSSYKLAYSTAADIVKNNLNITIEKFIETLKYEYTSIAFLSEV